MDTRLVGDLSSVEPEAWDALVGDDDPFVEHAFLATLEASGSVGRGTGWTPCHVTAWQSGELVGALPLYLKDHSYGEYIFDWAWADAAHRIGIPYYPKLVSMVPVTPATGRRFLVHPRAQRAQVVRALLEGAFHAAEESRASSLHLLFLNEEEREDVRLHPSLHLRLSQQFHFRNEGYKDFDDFLSRFRSATRKQVRRERRRVAESELDVEVVTGENLSPDDWMHLYDFYIDTCGRRGSPAYLTRSFFRMAASTLCHRTVVAMARREGVPVAATLNFEKGSHLYGRYWGCSEENDSLHFELCCTAVTWSGAWR